MTKFSRTAFAQAPTTLGRLGAIPAAGTCTSRCHSVEALRRPSWGVHPVRRARIQRPIPRTGTPTCLASQPTDDAISPAIVIVDHGSRRDAANEMLSDVTDMVTRRSNGVPVYSAHMEIAEPSIADAFALAVKNGATHIVIVPFFLSPGRHVTTDIPNLAEEAANNHAGVTYDVRPPIGTHPAIADVIMERAGAGVVLA